jgi:5-methylcytosine-specific restriction endonuclease McrA
MARIQKRTPVPSAERRKLALRYGCKPGERTTVECYWCGEIGAVDWRHMTVHGTPTSWPTFSLTVDHRVPLALGGTHDSSNLVFACRSCNACKGSKPPEEFDELTERAYG